MNNLENKLKGLQFNYDLTFAESVIERSASTRSMWPNPYWLFGALAASVFLCIGYIYLQDGALNLDTVLGVDQLLREDTEEIYTFL